MNRRTNLNSSSTLFHLAVQLHLSGRGPMEISYRLGVPLVAVFDAIEEHRRQLKDFLQKETKGTKENEEALSA